MMAPLLRVAGLIFLKKINNSRRYLPLGNLCPPLETIFSTQSITP
jgi:hypothetical protein